MHRRFGLFSIAILLALAAPTLLAAQTLARLAHEATPDIPHSTSNLKPTVAAHNTPLRESALSRVAARAFFVSSSPDHARLLSARALARDPQDAEALFVRMEAARVQADDAEMIRAATALCQIGVSAPGDLRVRLAALRLRQTAANTPAFRLAIPRLQALLANSSDSWDDLHEALLRAAMDGAPSLDPYAISRAAGVLTDWRIVGPLGPHPLLDQQPVSPSDDLSHVAYLNRPVENFAFPDGRIVLPEYLPHRGVFYAATNFSALTAGSWTVRSQTRGGLEVYVDGRRVLRADSAGDTSAALEVVPGPHHILLKFAGSATPLRIAVNESKEPAPIALPKRTTPQETAYLLGQLRPPTVPDSTPMWNASADVMTWAQRIAQHPSCTNLEGALRFYHDYGNAVLAQSMQRKLDGCAPESLAYAESLSGEGHHADAAQVLQRLLAAAPLNRPARRMLVRELQLAGDDEAAQQAAAEWRRIAPNAEDYRRLAARVSGDTAGQSEAGAPVIHEAFYQPYRRDAAAIARAIASTNDSPALVLVDDHVAIVREDGSVSLYVHRARRATSGETAAQLALDWVPAGAQAVAMRILHADGTAAPIGSAAPVLLPGDTLDEEYVLNYAGDGGIPEHAEAFQFVFGRFDQRVLYSRFVVLMPAGRADRGAVIASGDSPQLTMGIHNGMVARVWEDADNPAKAAKSSPAIVRVVEQENGWSEPSSAEHRRRIETIHPGPRPEES